MRKKPSAAAAEGSFLCIAAFFGEQFLFDIKKLLRKVDIIGMRIFKPLDLIPKRVKLFLAISADLCGTGGGKIGRAHV